MNKNTLSIALIIIGLIVFLQSRIFDSLLAFVLVGAIPGTSLTVPSTVMILAIISIAWLIVFRIVFSNATSPKQARPKKKPSSKKPARA